MLKSLVLIFIFVQTCLAQSVESNATRPNNQLVDDPVKAIRSALPKGWVIQKIEDNSCPFYRVKANGKAIFLAQTDASYLKHQYSVVIWIMPNDYDGRLAPRSPDDKQQTPSSILIAATKNAKVYMWGYAPELTQKILKAIVKPAVKKPVQSKLELEPALIEKRNRLLAEADANIRSGLVELAKNCPQLKKARDWQEVVSEQSEAGSISIVLFHTHLGKARSTRDPVPEKEQYSVLVIVRPPPSSPHAMSYFPKYPNLGLVGQVNATAGEPELQTALKTLIAKALVPLEQLENGQEKIKLHYQKFNLRLAIELLTISRTGKYHLGKSILVEARLKNTSDETQVYPRGFGMTSMQSCCQIELITPDGKAWAAEATPFRKFNNYEDIVLQPVQTVGIGKWNISQLQYNPGHVFRTMGDGGRTPFSSFAESGKYSVRWWDGVIQGRRPLVSPKLEFELISLEQ